MGSRREHSDNHPDGEDWQCPDCGEVIASHRSDAHRRFWCSAQDATNLEDCGQNEAADFEAMSPTAAAQLPSAEVSPNTTITPEVELTSTADLADEDRLQHHVEALGPGHPSTLHIMTELARQRAQILDYAATEELLVAAAAGYADLVSTPLIDQRERFQYEKMQRVVTRQLHRTRLQRQKRERSKRCLNVFFLLLTIGPGLCSTLLLGQDVFEDRLQQLCQHVGLCSSYHKQLEQLYLDEHQPKECQGLLKGIGSNGGQGVEWRACMLAKVGNNGLSKLDTKLKAIPRLLRKHKGREAELVRARYAKLAQKRTDTAGPNYSLITTRMWFSRRLQQARGHLGAQLTLHTLGLTVISVFVGLPLAFIVKCCVSGREPTDEDAADMRNNGHDLRTDDDKCEFSETSNIDGELHHRKPYTNCVDYNLS